MSNQREVFCVASAWGKRARACYQTKHNQLNEQINPYRDVVLVQLCMNIFIYIYKYLTNPRIAFFGYLDLIHLMVYK